MKALTAAARRALRLLFRSEGLPHANTIATIARATSSSMSEKPRWARSPSMAGSKDTGQGGSAGQAKRVRRDRRALNRGGLARFATHSYNAAHAAAHRPEPRQ